jgi:hypothetical protein
MRGVPSSAGRSLDADILACRRLTRSRLRGMSRDDVAASRRAALRTTLLRHLAVLPLWALRAVGTVFQGRSGIGALIALDALIALLHWRANRLSEVADPTNFGVNRSWTRLLYIPELVAVCFVIFDAYAAYVLYQRARTHWY